MDGAHNKAGMCDELLRNLIPSISTYTRYHGMMLSKTEILPDGAESDLFDVTNLAEADVVDALTPGNLFWFRDEPEPRQIYRINYAENQGGSKMVKNFHDGPGTQWENDKLNKRHRFAISVVDPALDPNFRSIPVSHDYFGIGSEQSWNPISNVFRWVDPNDTSLGYEAIPTGGNGQSMGRIHTDQITNANFSGSGNAQLNTKCGSIQPTNYLEGWTDPVTGNFTPNPTGHLDWLGGNDLTIEFLEDLNAGGAFDESKDASKFPAIFETEPKENTPLEVYYEASHAIPIHINEYSNEQCVPIGSTFFISGAFTASGNGFTAVVTKWTGPNTFEYEHITTGTVLDVNADVSSGGTVVESFTTKYNKNVQKLVLDVSPIPSVGTTGQVNIKGDSNAFVFADRPHQQEHILGWFNCYAFGNGVESDRIRDDFNEVTIDNGVKVNAVLPSGYRQESKANTLIFSGIYNSISGINETNQFIQGENITKQLSPRFGSIQKLFTRDTDLNVFCEDKVVKVLVDKDALFNANGDTNVTATNRFLGQTVAYPGDFGISKNPESFAADNRVMYFADKSRGAVIQLSDQGMMPISDIGMKDYFSDKLKDAKTYMPIIGTFDTKKDTYFISILQQGFNYKSVDGSVVTWPDPDLPSGGLPVFYTVAFNSKTKGWVCFQSFWPETGISLNNRFFTFNQGLMWEHNTNANFNSFYGSVINTTAYPKSTSSLTAVFNDNHSAVKTFSYINYEGTQAEVETFESSGSSSSLEAVGGGTTTYTYTGDGDFYNLEAKSGWKVNTIETDMYQGSVPYFKNKENKWFGYIKGQGLDESGNTNSPQVDTSNFNVQGLGVPASVTFDAAGGANNLNINLSV